MSALDVVIAKVRALRNLATSSNLNEAASAAAKADALIQEHRLSEADLEAAGEPASECIGDDGTPLDIMSRVETWKTSLRHALVSHYGCFTTQNRNWQRPNEERIHIRIIGRPSDVAIVRYMYAWLCSEISRLAESESGRRARNSFRHGAVRAIRESLAKSTAKVAEGHTSALALVSRSEEAERWAIAAIGKIAGGQRANVTVDPEAFARGKHAGASIHLGASLPAANARALSRGGDS